MAESVTALLKQLGKGDRTVLDELVPLVYHELHQIAAGYLRREMSGHTLQPTSLIHEAYLRLVEQSHPDYTSRAHFYGVAARVMRQILVDHARTRQALKRGGDEADAPLTDTLEFPGRPVLVVALDEALDRLTSVDERKARFVEMRFFAGMTAEEISECSDIPPYTVRRELRLAQAWLHKELAQ
ncbi:MAG: sigma-70 family RNA polymerase sigma factor [Bryobacteraceae bacterium]